MSSFEDPRSLASSELKALLNQLVEREQQLSTERRALHRHIDALRTELVMRIRDGEGTDVISGADPEDPGAGVREPRNPTPKGGAGAVALPEPPASEG